jgi:hypothetical protein
LAPAAPPARPFQRRPFRRMHVAACPAGCPWPSPTRCRCPSRRRPLRTVSLPHHGRPGHERHPSSIRWALPAEPVLGDRRLTLAARQGSSWQWQRVPVGLVRARVTRQLPQMGVRRLLRAGSHRPLPAAATLRLLRARVTRQLTQLEVRRPQQTVTRRLLPPMAAPRLSRVRVTRRLSQLEVRRRLRTRARRLVLATVGRRHQAAASQQPRMIVGRRPWTMARRLPRRQVHRPLRTPWCRLLRMIVLRPPRPVVRRRRDLPIRPPARQIPSGRSPRSCVPPPGRPRRGHGRGPRSPPEHATHQAWVAPPAPAPAARSPARCRPLARSCGLRESAVPSGPADLPAQGPALPRPRHRSGSSPRRPVRPPSAG